ncbi:MAG TPA: CHAT domain-containing protein [Dehalococcoidia bacterium]|nr:CHAT domain-containing protein [Dehalococcoidia bacterium]
MPAVANRAEAFVARLLAAGDAGVRRQLLADHGLDAEALRHAALLLVEEGYRVLGADPLRMEQLAEGARTLAAQGGDPFPAAMATMCFGDALRFQGRNGEALDALDAAYTSFQALSRPVEAARTRIGWVECAARLGRVMEAMSAARGARRVLRAYGEHYRAGSLELSVGIVHAQTGDHPAALRAFTLASRLYQRSGEAGRLGVARARQNRGLTLSILGRHREAVVEFEAARTVFEASGEQAGIARMSANLGYTYIALGQYTRALRALETALQLAQETGIAARDPAAFHGSLADCYLALNRPADALRQLESLEHEVEQVDSAADALALAARRAVALLRLGEREHAFATIDAALRAHPDAGAHHRAWLLTQQAAMQLSPHATNDAHGALRDALAAERAARLTGSSRLRAEALVVQAAALVALGRGPEAQRVAVRARRLAAKADAAPLLYRIAELRGQVAEAEANEPRAIQLYRAAAAQLEREQRGVIFAFRDSFALSRGLAYQRLAVLLLRAGKPSQALANVERAKSRALMDAIRGGFAPRLRGSGEVRRLARELQHAREVYAALRAGPDVPFPEVATTRRAAGGEAPAAEVEQRIVDLTRRLQIAGAAQGIADPLDSAVEETPPVMPAGAGLLEFAVAGDDLLRFLVVGGVVRGEILPGRVAQVERLIRAFRLNIESTERVNPSGIAALETQVRAVLSRLHALLLGGLDELVDLERLVVVPHGLLHYLPFAALHDGERFLVERFTLSSAPSAGLYSICRARTARRTGTLVLAHSAGGRLPHALSEAAAVGKVLGAPVWCEAEATRGRLARDGQRAAVIHIAAHGQFRADAPLFSGIELGDGSLTTADVFDLKLRAALVTLSACDTGRSVLGGGDELSGLVRAFLYAGAADLLVSLWRVDDAGTAELMARFYRELAGGTGLATALRRAQLELLSPRMRENGRSHPFFWAGFQLIGDDRSLTRRRKRMQEE